MLKKGDKVIIIAGKDRLKTGLIERVLPSKNRVVVTGANMVKKSQKRTAKTPQGGILEISQPLHISNVMLLDPKTNKPTRTGQKISGDKRIRIAKVSGEQA